MLGPEWFLYLDPPYLPETIHSGRCYYRYGLKTAGHRRLLELLGRCRARVMLSGYPSPMYARHLKTWHVESFQSMTRGGKRSECLWMNYPKPIELHDYRYLGDDYRQRERFKRQRVRWTQRLKRMDALQRRALLVALAEVDRSTSPP